MCLYVADVFTHSMTHQNLLRRLKVGSQICWPEACCGTPIVTSNRARSGFVSGQGEKLPTLMLLLPRRCQGGLMIYWPSLITGRGTSRSCERTGGVYSEWVGRLTTRVIGKKLLTELEQGIRNAWVVVTRLLGLMFTTSSICPITAPIGRKTLFPFVGHAMKSSMVVLLTSLKHTIHSRLAQYNPNLINVPTLVVWVTARRFALRLPHLIRSSCRRPSAPWVLIRRPEKLIKELAGCGNTQCAQRHC